VKTILIRVREKIRKDIIPNPIRPESFLKALEIVSRILKVEGRKVFIESGKIMVQVTDCENQNTIVKAGIADCEIVTVYTYQGVVKGLFGKVMDVI
jgi:hypothetical protein